MKKLFILSALLMLFTFATKAQKTVFDFNDGSWGAAVAERPESGSYTSSTIKDVKFNSAQLYQKDGKGTKRVVLDKKSTNPSIEFPAFTDTKSEIVIDASTGADDRTMVVEQKIGNKWSAIGEPTTLSKQKSTNTFAISDKATQVRIVNPTSSSLYIYKVTIK